MDIKEIIKICENEAKKNNAKFRGCTLADNYINNFPCDGTDCVMSNDVGCMTKEKAFLKAAELLTAINILTINLD